MTIFIIEVYDKYKGYWWNWNDDVYGSYEAMSFVIKYLERLEGSTLDGSTPSKYRITQT